VEITERTGREPSYLELTRLCNSSQGRCGQALSTAHHAHLPQCDPRRVAGFGRPDISRPAHVARTSTTLVTYRSSVHRRDRRVREQLPVRRLRIWESPRRDIGRVLENRACARTDPRSLRACGRIYESTRRAPFSLMVELSEILGTERTWVLHVDTLRELGASTQNAMPSPRSGAGPLSGELVLLGTACPDAASRLSRVDARPGAGHALTRPYRRNRGLATMRAAATIAGMQ